MKQISLSALAVAVGAKEGGAWRLFCMEEDAESGDDRSDDNPGDDDSADMNAGSAADIAAVVLNCSKSRRLTRLMSIPADGNTRLVSLRPKNARRYEEN
jgi:hypothetical protein